MPFLRCTVLIGALCAAGCGNDTRTTTDFAAATAAPAPAVSHAPTNDAARTGQVPDAVTASDAVSGSAHHAVPPVSAPSVDPGNPPVEPAAPVYREITIPAGTNLRLALGSAVSSDDNNVEDAVHATLRNAIVVNGVTVVPAGASVSGYVSEAARSGRVKGRARVGMRFNSVRVGDERYTIRTTTVSRQAKPTKTEDAAKIGVGAGAGAIIGAIAGGKKGAAIGTAVGGAGGTGVVLATRGQEVSLPQGTVVITKLSAPVKIRVK